MRQVQEDAVSSAGQHDHHPRRGRGSQTPVLEVGGRHRAIGTSVDAALIRRDGLPSVEANSVVQTAPVTRDPVATRVAQRRRWVEGWGSHFEGHEEHSPPGHAGRSGRSAAVAAPCAARPRIAHGDLDELLEEG